MFCIGKVSHLKIQLLQRSNISPRLTINALQNINSINNDVKFQWKKISEITHSSKDQGDEKNEKCQ